MLPEEIIKESLSRRYVEVIACRNGYKFEVPNPVTGVDLSITRSIIQYRNGKKRFIDTGEYIQLQIKSTTESSIIADDNSIKYDLESKTYNDLVFRVNSEYITPLYLILMILPDDTNKWVELSNNELVLRKSAFWYIPNTGSTPTTNSSSKRIVIPLNQIVDLSFLDVCFKEAYQ